MRKLDVRGEKNGGGGRKKKKIMSEIVATNIVASRQPERQWTGTLTACANFNLYVFFCARKA